MPEVDYRVYKGVKTQLSNAWREGVLVDEKGWLWVKKSKLHSILRTSPQKANYLTMALNEEDKRYFHGELYIRGYIVLGLIRKEQEEYGVGKKGINLLASEQFYNAIDRCETVRAIRLEYDSQKVDARKSLKPKRRRKYKIKFDELTGAPLKRNAEFSHIRSYSMYKRLSDNIDNGLLVNKEIHQLITERGINDENQLLALCQEQGWKTDWYETYITKFPF